MMRSLLVVSFLSSCAGSNQEPTASEMRAELLELTKLVTDGAQYESIAVARGFDCRKSVCGDGCRNEAATTDVVTDEILVCRWDEELQYSLGTFGSAFSVTYLTNGEIISTDVEVIHTGP